LVRLKGFQKLTPVEKALQIFFETVKIGKLRTVSVPLQSALNRVLAKDIVAGFDLPRVDRSAVDGYALKARDTTGTSQFKPKVLQISENGVIGAGQARQIWTGNAVPKGADAVIMLENVKKADEKVEVWSPVTPGDNVSKKGEDISKGNIAVKAGCRLKPQHIGLIAAFGVTEIEVFEKPKVAALATGSELVEIGSETQENQIFDVNRLILSSLCLELGAEPFDLGIVNDDVDEILRKLRSGLEKADVVLTSGGTSVGVADLVPEAVNGLGKPGVIVHGVALRPAMPTALAVVGGKPVIILSGNPVAAMVGFEIFARPLLYRMLGLKREEPRPTIEAELTRKVATTLGRKSFVRVRVFRRGKELFAEPISAKGSGIISTMTRANGFVLVPENREGLAEGEKVSVSLFDVVESA
jgi:molybdopterin molybdotransferase